MKKNSLIPVLHVITSLNVGGAERAITSLLTQQEGGKYYNIVLCLRGQGRFVRELEESGIEVYCWGLSFRSMAIVAIFKSIRRVCQIEPKIIHGWMYHGNLVGFLIRLCFVRKSALIWNVRHSLIDIELEKISTRCVIWFNKLLSRTPDQIIYNSKV